MNQLPINLSHLGIRSFLKNKFYFLAVIVFFTFIVVPDAALSSFFRKHSENIFPRPVITFFLMFLAILTSVSCWGIVFIINAFPKRASIMPSTMQDNSHQSTKSYKALVACQSSMILSATLYFAFLLIFRSGSKNSRCYTAFAIGDWNCNPYRDVPMFPMDTAFFLILMPSCFAIVMKEKRKKLTMISWVISIIGMLASAIIIGSWSSLPIVIIYFFLSGVVLLDNFRLHSLISKLHDSLRKSMQETQALLDQQKLNQMKDVIGNVSHDLKTPLSSFMQGIDLMMDLMSEFEEKLSPGLLKSELYSKFMQEMRSHMKSIRNTNAFMMMSINRTMDYTKASRGLKLVPNLDTIDLLETISLPLNCMKNIQNRVNIHLLPIHSIICNYIVTDKQWLQENILCLLSNSAKYSSDGEVSVSVSLRSTRSPYNNQVMANARPELYLSAEHSSVISSTNSSVYDLVVKSFRSFHKPVSTVRSYLLFEVEDTGIGMTKETMQSLFSPFAQAQRLAGGTGLGLYSLSKRIEALGGDYGVRERKDGRQGCLFWFTIPFVPDRAMISSLEESSRFSGSPKHAVSRQDSYFNDQQINHESNQQITNPQQQSFAKRSLTHAHTIANFRKKSKLDFSCIDNSYIDSLPTTSTNTTTSNTSSSGSSLVLEDVSTIRQVAHHQVISCVEEVAFHILLVEDSPTIAKMTSLMLTKLGYHVTVAENGHIGLKKMMEVHENKSLHPFDIVLMDFQMPVMDGLEATKRFREFERSHYSKQPVDDDNASVAQRQLIIGLSATFDKEIIDDAMTCGLDDYLMKPIQKDTFIKKIEKIMAKRSQFSINQIHSDNNNNNHNHPNNPDKRADLSHPLHSSDSKRTMMILEDSNEQKLEIA